MLEKNLSTVKVRNLFLPEWKNRNDTWKKLQRTAEKNGIRVWKVSAGKYIKSDKSELRFLAPEKGASGEDVNEDGVVMEIRYGEFRGLLTGDIGENTEKKLLPVLEDVDFLKVGHHGSHTSSSKYFIDKINPKYSIISAGKNNRYNHPNEETLNNLEKSKIYRTDQDGSIIFKIKNNKLKIETCSP